MQLIIGIEGTILTAQDIKRLQHPCVAGVILFKRNFASYTQLQALTSVIKKQRQDLFISIDHEGGRVQRLRENFTRLPSANTLLKTYRLNPSLGLSMAECTGFIMAIELQAVGIDLSYAPVLDLDFGLSDVIGDRSFGSLTQEVIALAGAVMRGMHQGGMSSVGKHFPGHGGVIADTHGEIAIDPRPFESLWQADIAPFQRLIQQGLNAIMPAHVIYSKVDKYPAGFSKIWLNDILRGMLKFNGIIISDDLDMAGANAIGDLKAKLEFSAKAGCDLALICNNLNAIDEALQLHSTFFNPLQHKKFTALFGKFTNTVSQNLLDQAKACRARIAPLSL